MQSRLRIIVFGLVLITALVWSAALSLPDQNMHLIACDVGQGDAILIQQGRIQILIDGGRGREVMDCLSENMPFWDREVELVILTHPQLDHFGGLIDVFRTYQVGHFLASGLDSGSQEYQLLKKSIGGSGARLMYPESVASVRLGMMYIDVVHPKQDFVSMNSRNVVDSGGQGTLGTWTTEQDPNDFSIVAILRLGSFEALFTGDIGPEISDRLAESGLLYDLEYIKIPHHGSKNGLTKNLLRTTTPELAVISSGANNQFGHPHREVIDMLNDQSVQVLRTDELGDVEVVIDGDKFWIER